MELDFVAQGWQGRVPRPPDHLRWQGNVIRVMQSRGEGMSMPFVKGSIGKEICTGYRPEGVPCRLGGRNGGGPPSSTKREEDHGELSL